MPANCTFRHTRFVGTVQKTGKSIENIKEQMSERQFKSTFARNVPVSIKKTFVPDLCIQTLPVQNRFCFVQWTNEAQVCTEYVSMQKPGTNAYHRVLPSRMCFSSPQLKVHCEHSKCLHNCAMLSELQFFHTVLCVLENASYKYMYHQLCVFGSNYNKFL